MAIDPIRLADHLWPHHGMWSKQLEIIESVEQCPITVVPSANKTGKDYVASHIVVSHAIRYPQVRIITTSIRDDHLRILWDEIQRWIETCRFRLVGSNNLFYLKYRDIRKYASKGKLCPISYVRGLVSEKPEGFAGHHAEHTLAVIDECSGIDDSVIDQIRTWAKRILMIGNPLPTTNYFYKWVKEGNVLSPV